MTKARLLVATIAGFVGISGIAFYTAQQYRQPSNTSAAQVRSLLKTPSSLQISNDKKSVSFAGQDGKTALALLRAGAQVKTEQSSFGEFVTAINGVEADGITQLWAFYVNDQLADDAAETYITKAGERIEFRVENVQ